jgi:hypothetical protein
MPLAASYYPGIGEHDCSRNVRHSQTGGRSPTQMKMAERRRILANTQCAVARTSWSAFFPCVLNKPQTNPIAPEPPPVFPAVSPQPCFTNRTQSAAESGCPRYSWARLRSSPVFSTNPKRTQIAPEPPPVFPAVSRNHVSPIEPNPRWKAGTRVIFGRLCVLPLCFQQTPNEPNLTPYRRLSPPGVFRPPAPGPRPPTPGMSALFSRVFNKPQTNPISPRTARLSPPGCSGPRPQHLFTERTQSRPQPVIIPPKGHSSSCVSRY